MPLVPTRVRRCALADRMLAPSACPEPRAGSTTMLFARYSARSWREAELHQQIWNVLLVRVGGRILLAHDLIQLRFRVCAARTKAVVPDVEWLEWTTKPSLRPASPFQRTDGDDRTCSSICLTRVLRYLATFVEPARNQSRRGRRIWIGLPHGLEIQQQFCVTSVWLGSISGRVVSSRNGFWSRR